MSSNEDAYPSTPERLRRRSDPTLRAITGLSLTLRTAQISATSKLELTRSRIVDALIVVDAVGLLSGAPKHDLRGAAYVHLAIVHCVHCGVFSRCILASAAVKANPGAFDCLARRRA
jgi:hypothetical protein